MPFITNQLITGIAIVWGVIIIIQTMQGSVVLCLLLRLGSTAVTSGCLKFLDKQDKIRGGFSSLLLANSPRSLQIHMQSK